MRSERLGDRRGVHEGGMGLRLGRGGGMFCLQAAPRGGGGGLVSPQSAFKRGVQNGSAVRGCDGCEMLKQRRREVITSFEGG